ncbi:MAG TPA: UDP-N-acetylmuramoyl-L-alanine--D-glutamate ligase [Longimicrobiaceae bacterium]|nr:UDP-N-acetylmuramoyl-L-alanine--D-glutamate ligase [Longimicrobiaceae bacterium]
MIGVLGLARSGLAAARLAISRGETVYASDGGATPATAKVASVLRELGAQVDEGGHDLERLAACSEIVVSPGIPPGARVLSEPVLAEVPFVSEIEFALRFIDAPAIAVTGTNGKTTVTALIGHLLREAGRDAIEGGNIGTALSEVAMRVPQPEIVVVEASSFQLGRLIEFSPEIGVLTNLAPDHLDRYASVEDYYADKERLFLNATPESRWLTNAEDERARAMAIKAAGKHYWFRIGSAPVSGEEGGYLSTDGWLTLRLDGSEERLIAASELRILGPHNVANALAAAIAAKLAGADSEAIRAGLPTFGALSHRMEPVHQADGVIWINDSKATNISSTRVALRSLEYPVVLLLGGRHKGESYTQLLPEMKDRVRLVVAFGEAADTIVADLATNAEVETVEGSFRDMMDRVGELVRSGDTVLLSPACSSFDMFSDFEERGRRFTELARRETP